MSAPVLGRFAPPTLGRYGAPQPRRRTAPTDRRRPAPIDPRETPIHVTQLDLDAPDAPDGSPTALLEEAVVLALVRLHRHPLGVISVRVGPGGDLSAGLRRAAAVELGGAILEHERRDQVPGGPQWGREAAWPAGAVPPCLSRRAELLGDPPRISVIIGTREHPAELERCLSSLAALDYPKSKYEVLVVDNDPATEETRRTAERADGPVRYLRTRRRGLAVAHNLGAAEATGRILAFTDDDVVVDRDWLLSIAEAFTDRRVGCVTGLIMPGELRTPAQAMLERRGGYAKGFQPRVFEAGGPAADDSLFPFTAGRMGSGANMAFDADLLDQLRGFDPAMGAGTVARGGDDLLALFRAIEAGSRVVYQPDALVWHHHRQDAAALTGQAFSYGVGLTAYLTAALIHEPATLPALVRRLPRGLVYALRNSSPDREAPGAWPARLSALERRGLLYGPVAYLYSRWLTRQAGERLTAEDLPDLAPEEHRS